MGPPRKYQTIDDIGKAMLKVREAGEPLSFTNMTTNHVGLYAAAKRYFGGWKNVLRHMGVEPDVEPTGAAAYTSRAKVISIPEHNKDYAYFLGLLLGDGCIYYRNIDGHPKRYTISLNSVDKELADSFARIGKDMFGVKPRQWLTKPRTNTYACKSQWAVSFLSKNMCEYLIVETNKKDIPKWIVDGTPELMGAFIRGFADAEGSAPSEKFLHITIAQMDKKILYVIQFMLYKLGIYSRILSGGVSGCWYLHITSRQDVSRYMELVGFGLRRKADRIMAILNNPQGSQKMLDSRARTVKNRRKNFLSEHVDEWRSLGLEV